MAGIKIYAPIDTEISHNHIYRTCRGIWLDWMTQGTRVTRNLLHDNGPDDDLLVEVNHGPFMVDHNLFLSPISLFDRSQGGAYVHNLFAGRFRVMPERGRRTPYHEAHSTKITGLRNIPGGDNRFYNNIFVDPAGLSSYDELAMRSHMAGNVFLHGAAPSRYEKKPLVQPEFDPAIRLSEKQGGGYLHIRLDEAWAAQQVQPIVTTELLGKATVPELPFVQPDGSPYHLRTDYFGDERDAGNPCPGPFALPGGGEQAMNVWSLVGHP